jgi:1,4-alpha-glucan branching enzyme
VRFELVAPDAQSVFLAGSFNHWNAKATRLVRLHDGKWAKELWLPTGRYEYLFVVDGQWTADPKANDHAPNPFGGSNCVIEV